MSLPAIPKLVKHTGRRVRDPHPWRTRSARLRPTARSGTWALLVVGVTETGVAIGWTVEYGPTLPSAILATNAILLLLLRWGVRWTP
ncbi:hypothetical protein C1I98_11000 [Spongiactinospora gelatinilytica]|uniref:Uncharacterized protein n=1 Tax=Spongiactinospora gelatinilytica TaxID=2666298 RepID=A0A2W2GJY0_9ACTN|nr:hypothetical protein [Spongiactinospora gelatinilytica]PZG49836.1 hypothetical protein C1I98_11000 [Spongiactinospora gelatinilytica]